MCKKSFILKAITIVLTFLLLVGCGDTAEIPTVKKKKKKPSKSNSSSASSLLDSSDNDLSSQFEDVDDESRLQDRPWVTYVPTKKPSSPSSSNETSTSDDLSSNPSSDNGVTDNRTIYSKEELLQLMNYLTYDTDNYAIGLHGYGQLDISNQIKTFEKRTGKKPAYIDFDMNTLPFGVSERSLKSVVSQLTDFAKSGGFIAITDHWLTPTKSVSTVTAGGANNSRDLLTKDQYYEVMTDGTTLNKNFLEELKYKSDFLKMLSNNGVPVIYRPLHEGNGGWFWWGINNERNISGKDVAELYKYVYNYFTVTNGLNNILWEFCTAIAGYKDKICDWYPGNNYVDILSTDWYIPYGDYKGIYDETIYKCGKKPYAVSEYGGDGNYNTSEYSIKETLNILEKELDKGSKASYVGLYFELSDKQDCTLTNRSITLDMIKDYWTKAKG